MTLTLDGGPLASHAPDTVNYRIDGPAHRLFWHPFPRRIRALFAGRTILDTTNAKLLHESNLLPQLYIPRADLRTDLLQPTNHTTHCPFKGDATYESIVVGDRVTDNAIWTYPRPLDSAQWLANHSGVYWNSADAWFDEDDEVFGEIRDPYHRVDIRHTSRHIRVAAAGVDIADTRHALLLSETGLPNRFYLPPTDIHTEYLTPSATHTICPYKGTASYHGLHVNDATILDAAWSYPQPLPEASQISGYLCFLGEGIQTWVDGIPLT